MFLAAFAAYVRLLTPGLAGDDVPEMVLAALRLDVTHPPGYPLYALAGRLAALLPAGGPAFRLGLLSAAAAAGGVALAFAAGARLGGGRMPGAAAALLLGGAHTWWWQAEQADKYAAHGLLVVLVAAAAVSPRAGPPLFGLAWGVALAHHPLAVFLAPLAWLTRRGLRRPRGLALAALAVLLPASLKPLYAGIRSAAGPPVNWGRPAQARALAGYLGVRGYAPKIGLAGVPWRERLPAHLRFYPHQTGAAGAAAALLGLCGLARALPHAAAAFALAWAGTFVFAAQFRLDAFLAETYHLAGVVLACLAAGAGLPLLAGRSGRTAACAALLLWGAWRAAARWPDFDFSRSLLLQDFNAAVLRAVPPGSALLAGSDYDLFALRYLTAVEGRRPDVAILELPATETGAQTAVVADLVRTLPPGRCLAFTVLSRPLLGFATAPCGPALVPRELACAATLPPPGRAWRRLAPRGAFTPAARHPSNRSVLAAFGDANDAAAEAAAAAGREQEALALNAARARLLPELAVSWAARGALQANAGRRLDALASLERAVRLEPAELPAYASALEIVRAAKAWRAVPPFAEQALAALPLTAEWTDALRGALARGAHDEVAAVLGVALAEEAERRAEDLEAGRTMLLADPRRPGAMLALHRLALRFDPGWKRPAERARQLERELGLRL